MSAKSLIIHRSKFVHGLDNGLKNLHPHNERKCRRNQKIREWLLDQFYPGIDSIHRLDIENAN